MVNGGINIFDCSAQDIHLIENWNNFNRFIATCKNNSVDDSSIVMLPTAVSSTLRNTYTITYNNDILMINIIVKNAYLSIIEVSYESLAKKLENSLSTHFKSHYIKEQDDIFNTIRKFSMINIYTFPQHDQNQKHQL